MIDKKEGVLSALHSLKVDTGSLACLGCGHEHNCGVHGCAILREAEEVIRELIADNVSLRQRIDGITDAQAVVVKEFDRKLEELVRVRAERDAAVAALERHGDCEDCANFSNFEGCPKGNVLGCDVCQAAGCPCRDCEHVSKWTFAVVGEGE